MPGSIPAPSHLEWLISMTAMIVLFWSRATRDLLKSLGWGMLALHRFRCSDEVAIPRRPPRSVYRFRATGPRRELPSAFRVSDLAAGAIGAAALAISELVGTIGRAPNVRVDRRLSALWFGWSIKPVDW